MDRNLPSEVVICGRPILEPTVLEGGQSKRCIKPCITELAGGICEKDGFEEVMMVVQPNTEESLRLINGLQALNARPAILGVPVNVRQDRETLIIHQDVRRPS